MKTCIVKGFVDVPGTKYYYYHGMLRPCNIQPEIECFDKIDTEENTTVWQLIYEEWPVQSGYYYLNYILEDFIPSVEEQNCDINFLDDKRRYYFYEVDYYKGSEYPYLWFAWQDGFWCFQNFIQQRVEHLYKANYSYLIAETTRLIFLQNPATGSHIRIWRSKDGELPDYFPVPQA